MSDNIVERLRAAKGSERHGPLDDGSYSLALLDNVDLCHEAAAEIEALRADAQELLVTFIEGGYAEAEDEALLNRLHDRLRALSEGDDQ